MIPPKVRKAVIARANECCERCGRWVDVENGRYSLQHRRARGSGGSKAPDTNTAVNLAVLCGHATEPDTCHQYVESHPKAPDVIDDGWRVPQGHDPATMPIRHWELGPVLLTDNYTYMETAA